MSPHSSHAEIEAFDERQFYLEEFRGRTLLFSVPVESLEDVADERALAGVLQALANNGTRVVVLAGCVDAHADAVRVGERLAELVAGVGQARGQVPTLDPEAARASGVAEVVALVWEGLRRRPLFAAVVSRTDAAATHRFAAHVAARLRVRKLVLVDRAGGLCGSDGRILSFLDEAALAALLAAGEAEWTGLATRLEVVDSARHALLDGVASVNVCTLLGVARELFTYEGSGTLLTLKDYCLVERLGIDDFEEAERLIERGQREGVLKPRSAAEVARLLANGYGATIATHHLAGFCAFVTEPYVDASAGEIVGLYTITRFKGEGVGDRLLDRILSEAGAMGLHFVFATTTSTRAQAFFERRGFVRVEPEDVPPAKWVGYSEERRRRAAVLRLDLARGER